MAKCGGCEPPLFGVRETDAGVVGVTIRVVVIRRPGDAFLEASIFAHRGCGHHPINDVRKQRSVPLQSLTP